MSHLYKCLAFSCLFLITLFAVNSMAEELLTFRSELNQTRYQSLVEELRCPKCQNQNLADSNSSIAIDLRKQVYLMIESGKSDQEIVDYMVARYGEFVLYRPSYSSATYLLWYGPFAFLVLGLMAFIMVLVTNKKKVRTSL
ncbi:cytochrome c-type biogenesis protein CcmH [Marinomonas sp. C2222]|uniref:Cytochrome c-type biogenesis protein n=1 Tax=Marinomonas sargassi TaxID=2984494 RepID=A0ABT2YN91_9GAMM|nr:cytochrome c-type biogenesis protein [Marinomonas sargassi]MCV2401358.1 cytochrome c-type biogenesis protein CcmH [Marinomonas sargassi]